MTVTAGNTGVGKNPKSTPPGQKEQHSVNELSVFTSTNVIVSGARSPSHCNRHTSPFHRFAGINSLTNFLKEVSLTIVCVTLLTPYVT